MTAHPPPPEFDVVVSARELIAEDVLRINLVRRDGLAFPPWSPGSHIDVLLPSGIERQYSLCGDTDQSETWSIAVLREQVGRGGSAWLHGFLAAGSPLRVRGPWNHFVLEPASRYRFVAGGIGITALLPMIRAVEAQGASWELDYASRTAERAAFAAEVHAIGGERVRMHVAADGARLEIRSLRPEQAELVYACGPARMLDELAEHAALWDAGTLHVERFEPVTPTATVPNAPFTVDLVLSGDTVEVDAQESLLDAVERAGVFVLSSCREGTCGTCETVVVEGTVEHRDSILTEAERQVGDRMMICVSRAASDRLALEL